MRNTRTQRRGGNALEFVLCLPVWVAIVVATVDFSWLFFQQTSLDAATNVGCRAGSLIDPGTLDGSIDTVKTKAKEEMAEVLLSAGVVDCTSCVFDAYTNGDPPERSLVCNVSREVDPIVGMFVSRTTLVSSQVARLEWQRASASE